MEKQDYILKGINIVKSFETENRVLDRVNLNIRAGEFVAVMGPSGSGKSTLLYVMSGVDRSDEGKVFFDGRDLSECGEKELAGIRRLKMGFVFQHPAMLKNLNLLDNILLPSMAGGKKGTKDLAAKAEGLMEQTGIGGLGQRGISQVSGGQLQRAGICRALMGSPKMLFADEPTGALNSKSAEEIMDLLDIVNASGTAVMLVTHDARIAARTERVLFMRDGNIVDELRFGGGNKDGWEDRKEKVASRMREIGI